MLLTRKIWKVAANHIVKVGFQNCHENNLITFFVLGLQETAVIRDLSNWRHRFPEREIIR